MLLQMVDISKSFPGVKALDNVSLDLSSGEVLGIVGENGAGKSTLMKILSGDYEKDSGEVLIDDRVVEFRTPADSREAGVRVIYQELQSFESLTVSENIFVGELPYRNRLGTVDWRRMRKEANEALGRMDVRLNPRTPVEDLSVHEKQIVEIAKAIHRKARILVMDEPTAALGSKDTQSLFRIIRGLKQQGVGVIYVSHRMEEVFEITDRVIVLRDGHKIGTINPKETSTEELVSMMVGGKVDFSASTTRENFGEELFRVENLTIEDLVTDVSFSVRAGEVLGFFGLLGSGRLNILSSCYGLERATGGKFFVRGKRVTIESPRDAMRAGIGYMPLDRKLEGLALPLSVMSNISMNNVDRIGTGFLIDRSQEAAHCKRWIERVNIKTPSNIAEVGTLSGGNQQKVVLAKMLEAESEILILIEPTRGIDVATKGEIYDIIEELCGNGCAVLLVSSEIPEMIRLSDRILVISRGRTTAELCREEVSQERLLSAAAK